MDRNDPSYKGQSGYTPLLLNFDNLGDTAEGLRRILEESFEKVEVDIVGSTANFTATTPRST